MNYVENKRIKEHFGNELKFIIKNSLLGCGIIALSFIFGIFVSLGKMDGVIIPMSLFIAAIIVIPAAAAW